MSAKDKELEIESITDITVLRKLRGPRKGQLTKLEKDLTRYRDAPLGELKRVTLEAMVSNLDKQLQFYLLIQDRILHLMHDKEAEELTKEEEKEEQERDTQHYAATSVRERLYDLISTADTMAKVKRVYRRLEGFQKSDSLRDSDILDKLQKIDPIIDEILETEAALPDFDELHEQIQKTQLLYRQQTKEALRAKPDPVTVDSRAVDAKPAIKLPKTDMPTFEGEPKLWRRFWERFTQRLDMHPTLPASEKIAQLEQAIKPLDGKALISAPKGTESEYQECIKNVKARYDQPRKIYRAHVHEVMDHSTP